MKKASLVGAFFVSVFWAMVASAACSPPGPLQVGDVVQVVDGDTLRLEGGRSVRLIGVNTPEIGRKGHRSEPYAETARRHLLERVQAGGGRVWLHTGREPRDQYGRWLAHAFDQDGNSLEAALLEAGLGYFVAVQPNTELAECLQSAEQRARNAGLGLWRKSPVQAAAAVREGGFALVEGRVGSVQRNRGGVWLEFNGDLVVQIPPGALGEFGHFELQALAGKDVEVRGWVIDRARRKGHVPGARWMIRVTHPAMLRVR